MELNKNSKLSQLYRWFYRLEEWDMPNSLCPYFWKLVLMWILLIPVIIFLLPVFIVSNFKKHLKFHTNDERFADATKLWFIFIASICVLSLIGLIWDTSLFTEKEPTILGIMNLFGFCCVGTGLILFFIHLYIEYDINRIDKPIKIKKPSIIIEFIKAKYNKYCPRIDWT